MRIVRASLVLSLLITTCGCVTDLDRQGCASYGYQPGSSEFAGCLQRRDEMRSIALMNLGQQISAASQAPVMAAPPRPIQTMCVNNGPYAPITCMSQ
jgi:hypothetical protein